MKEELRGIIIYHSIKGKDDFQKSATILFELIKTAQVNYPNKKRILSIDIEGHKNAQDGFDHDMFELQKHFIVGFLMQYISEVNMPLVSLKNKNQINDIPDILSIQPGKRK